MELALLACRGVLAGVLITSLLTPQHLAAQVGARPRHQTIRYLPIDTQIESIPVATIHPSWTRVLVLRKDNQPAEILQEVAEHDAAQFEIVADLDGTGSEERVLVGVYRTMSDEFGKFVLILGRDNSGGWRPVFTCAFPGEPGFSILFRRTTSAARPHVLHSFCLACDVLAVVSWDQGYQIVGSGGPRGVPFRVNCA